MEGQSHLAAWAVVGLTAPYHVVRAALVVMMTVDQQIGFAGHDDCQALGVTGQKVVINVADGRHAGVTLRQDRHWPLAKQVRMGLAQTR